MRKKIPWSWRFGKVTPPFSGADDAVPVEAPEGCATSLAEEAELDVAAIAEAPGGAGGRAPEGGVIPSFATGRAIVVAPAPVFDASVMGIVNG